MDNLKFSSDAERNFKFQLDSLKIEAKQLNEKLLNLKWKVKRADFVAFYEAKEREELLGRIKTVNDMIDQFEERSNSVDLQYEQQNTALRELQLKYQATLEELKKLKDFDQKNESEILDLTRSINVLKNRNAAMMTKLKRQKENFDMQIQSFSQQRR